MSTFSEWFFLKSGRLNFKPSVSKDGELIFCHDQIQNDIHTRIERSFALSEPIKMMLYGDWGVGKTHTVHHVAWWLKQHEAKFPAITYLTEVGDVTKKSRFDILVRRFLDEIGITKIINLVHEYQASGHYVVNALQKCGVSKPIAEAYGKFLLVPPGETPPLGVAQTFAYLKGLPVKDSGGIGLGEPLQESEDLYGVLVAMGELIRTVDKKQVIFVADEAAKLEAVEGDEATSAHWVAVNRMIFDDNNTYFGFIYTLSAKGLKNVPPLLTPPQVQNRLGKHNYIELSTLVKADVENFLKRLVQPTHVPGRNDACASTHGTS